MSMQTPTLNAPKSAKVKKKKKGKGRKIRLAEYVAEKHQDMREKYI